MDRQPQRIWAYLDLLIPVGAIAVMAFSLSTVFFDPNFHIPNKRAHEILKAYKQSAMAALPY